MELGTLKCPVCRGMGQYKANLALRRMMRKTNEAGYEAAGREYEEMKTRREEMTEEEMVKGMCERLPDEVLRGMMCSREMAITIVASNKGKMSKKMIREFLRRVYEWMVMKKGMSSQNTETMLKGIMEQMSEGRMRKGVWVQCVAWNQGLYESSVRWGTVSRANAFKIKIGNRMMLLLHTEDEGERMME